MKRTNTAIVVTVVLGALGVVLCLGAGQEPDQAAQYKTVFVATVMQPGRGGVSDVAPDGPKFAQGVQTAITNLARQGYDVVETIPVIRGNYRWETGTPRDSMDSASAFGYGYGYSYTSGVTIVARKR